MTVMTTERPAAVAQPQAGSLAIRGDQTRWTEQQQAVLQQSGINNDVTSAELSAFLHLCQRTKLDPFSRQIYLIGRWDGRAGRKVYTPQTSIDGYRVIAHRAAAEARHAFGYGDTLWCATDGRWRDVWLSDEPPAAAKVTVVRNGQQFSAVARYSEYVQTKKDGAVSGLWGKMPATMTAKCAEALALRMAFPHDLAGVYTAEEMAQADNPAPEPQFQRQTPGQDAWEQATPAAGGPRESVPSAASPAPQQQTPPDVVATALADVPPESLTPNGRDYLHEVHAAPDQATARQIYDDAKAEGAAAGYLAQIAQVGMTKPEKAAPSDGEIAADTAQARDEMFRAARDAALTPEQADAGFKTRYGTAAVWGTAEQLREYAAALTAPQAPDAEEDGPTGKGGYIEPLRVPAAGHAQAEERLRIAASRAHLATVDTDFQRVYGVTIEQATPLQLAAFADRIENAGGAQ